MILLMVANSTVLTLCLLSKVIVADFAPGAQFPAIVYDYQVKQRGAPYRIRWKFMTIFCSTAPTSILPTPRVTWPIMSHKIRNTQTTALSSEEDQIMATVNMYRKCC